MIKKLMVLLIFGMRAIEMVCVLLLNWSGMFMFGWCLIIFINKFLFRVILGWICWCWLMVFLKFLLLKNFLLFFGNFVLKLLFVVFVMNCGKWKNGIICFRDCWLCWIIWMWLFVWFGEWWIWFLLKWNWWKVFFFLKCRLMLFCKCNCVG